MCSKPPTPANSNTINRKMTLTLRPTKPTTEAYLSRLLLTIRLNQNNGPDWAGFSGRSNVAHNAGDNVNAFRAENATDVEIAIANC